jgi:hypothetical protein
MTYSYQPLSHILNTSYKCDVAYAFQIEVTPLQTDVRSTHPNTLEADMP